MPRTPEPALVSVSTVINNQKSRSITQDIVSSLLAKLPTVYVDYISRYNLFFPAVVEETGNPGNDLSTLSFNSLSLYEPRFRPTLQDTSFYTNNHSAGENNNNPLRFTRAITGASTSVTDISPALQEHTEEYPGLNYFSNQRARGGSDAPRATLLLASVLYQTDR
jgi:hypothetical protein